MTVAEVHQAVLEGVDTPKSSWVVKIARNKASNTNRSHSHKQLAAHSRRHSERVII